MSVIKHIPGILIGGLLFGVFLFFFYSRAPVVVFMEGLLVDRDRTSAVYDVTGYKVRDCRLIDNSFVGYWAADDGRWQESGPVSFPRDPVPNNSRPRMIWRQHFGLFRLEGVPSQAKQVRVTVEHLCDEDLLPTITTMGPWDV